MVINALFYLVYFTPMVVESEEMVEFIVLSPKPKSLLNQLINIVNLVFIL